MQNGAGHCKLSSWALVSGFVTVTRDWAEDLDVPRSHICHIPVFCAHDFAIHVWVRSRATWHSIAWALAEHWCAAPTRANHLWRLSTLYPCEDTASPAGGGTNEVENVSIRWVTRLPQRTITPLAYRVVWFAVCGSAVQPVALGFAATLCGYNRWYLKLISDSHCT